MFLANFFTHLLYFSLPGFVWFFVVLSLHWYFQLFSCIVFLISFSCLCFLVIHWDPLWKLLCWIIDQTCYRQPFLQGVIRKLFSLDCICMILHVPCSFTMMSVHLKGKHLLQIFTCCLWLGKTFGSKSGWGIFALSCSASPGIFYCCFYLQFVIVFLQWFITSCSLWWLRQLCHHPI